MSVSGLCEICESGSVEDGCNRCSRLVCARHYDEPTGLCTVCVAELGEDPEDGDRGIDDSPDGVDEYQF